MKKEEKIIHTGALSAFVFAKLNEVLLDKIQSIAVMGQIEKILDDTEYAVRALNEVVYEAYAALKEDADQYGSAAAKEWIKKHEKFVQDSRF